MPALFESRSVQDHGEPGGRNGHEHEKEGKWSEVELERDVPSEAREACLRVCKRYEKETWVEQYGEQCQQPLIRVETIKACSIECFPEFHIGTSKNLKSNKGESCKTGQAEKLVEESGRIPLGEGRGQSTVCSHRT